MKWTMESTAEQVEEAYSMPLPTANLALAMQDIVIH